MQSNYSTVRGGSIVRGMMAMGILLGASSALSIGLMAPAAQATEPAANPGQPVPLPYSIHDALGMQWDVQADGSISSPGNGNAQSGGILLLGHAAQYAPNAQTAQFIPATNELIFPSFPLGGLNVSRRVRIDLKSGWCRWVEILENPNATAVTTPLEVTFDLGATVQSSQPVNDEKTHKAMGLAVSDGNRGIAMLDAGHGSTVAPTITAQQGSNDVGVAWSVEVPAHKTIAIMHLQVIRPNVGQAQSFLEKFHDRDLLQGLPPSVQKIIVNFPNRSASFGDMELLTDDLLDVVELRGGDQYKGTIQETALSLQTPYGVLELPAKNVLAMLAVGDFRPNQLIVTREGEAFAGTLKSPVIHLQLASGQVTQIPIGSIRRFGFRKHAGEPEEFKYEHAMLILRNGDHIAVQTPLEPIPVATRYGNLLLKPQSIGALVFQGEDQPVHEVLMTDGSRFAGLVGGEALELQPISTGASKPVSFPAATVMRLQLSAKIDEPGEQSPILSLTTGDRLVGVLGGKLLLETAFDTIEIDGAEVRGLRRAGSAPTEMQILLWDETTLSGRLKGDVLEMALRSGPVLRVPTALLDEYSQPEPLPPASVLEKLRGLVTDLASDDWKRADRASSELGSMGPRITGALKTLRARQGKPVQERIDGIIKRFEPKAAVPATPD